MFSKPKWLVIIAIGLATFSRFYALDVLPPQVWFDEIWLALKARQFLQTGEIHIFYKTFWGGVHPLMVILTASVQALGFDSPIASRIISSISGVIGIPLAYICFNELWRDTWAPPQRRITSALVALILSNLLSYVVVSRVGLEWALAAALTLCCIWLFHLAQRTEQLTLWTLAGATVGASQYHSQHMRFLIPLIGLFILDDWVHCRSEKKAQFIRGIGLLGLAAVLVTLPLLVFFAREPEWLVARANIITQANEQSRLSFLLGNLWLVVLSFIKTGSQVAFDNVPGRPLFDGLQLVGFGIGVVWAITQLRRSPARKLLLWLVVMAAPSILTNDAPSFGRMINLMPAAAALVAIGWVGLGQWVTHRLHLANWQRWLIASCWLMASLGMNTYAYFAQYPQFPALKQHFTAGITELTRQLIVRSRTEPVFIERITEAINTPYFDFLLPDTPVHYLDFRQCLPLSTNRATRTTYLVNSERDPHTADKLTNLYPQARVTPISSESSWLVDDLTLVEVSPQMPISITLLPSHARFEPGLNLLGYTWSGPMVKPGGSVFITLYWEALTDPVADYTAFVHVGTGFSDSPLIAQHDAQPCQGFYPTSKWRTSDVVPDSFAVTIPHNAVPGEYPLVIGWYSYPSLNRLPLTTADYPLPDNRAIIAKVKVVPG